MHCNITYVRRKGAELVNIRSEKLDGDFITIGSDKNQDIFLDDVYVISQHAEIVLHKKKLFIIAVDGENTGGVSVNNELVQTKELKKGDILSLGDFEVTVVDSNSKLKNLQLQIEKKTDGIPATRSFASRLSLRLEDTWLIKKRNWSASIFAFILLLFLLIPLLSFFMPTGVSEKLRSLPVIPSDNSWETGDLAYAHHIEKIGNNCNKCHQEPFVMVEDKSCANSACHQKIQEHIDPKLYTENNLKQNRCGSCHKEHNGDDNDLIDSNDKLCFGCHHAVTEKGTYDNEREIQNVIDLETHPEFHISLHELDLSSYKLDQSNKKFDIERYSLENIESLKQASNLKFPHDKHLVYKGIENKVTGEKNVELTCESCHVPTASGTGFKPITRKDNCESCHLLTFEPEYKNDKSRQVPHGNVAEVLYYLNGYYSTRLLKGIKEEPKPTEEKETSTGRVRPGASSSDNTLDTQERVDSKKWVEDKVKSVSTELFEKTACFACHEVSKNEGATPAWSILPVRINQRWFPKALAFNHKKHAFEKCTSCHDRYDHQIAKKADGYSEKNEIVVEGKTKEQIQQAHEERCKEAKKETKTSGTLLKECTQLASSESSDILMPNLDKCKECHTSINMAEKSKTSCVTCHGFHINKDHIMGQAKDKEKK